MHAFDVFKAKSRVYNTVFCDDFNYLVNLQCFYPPWLCFPGKKEVTDYKKDLVKRGQY